MLNIKPRDSPLVRELRDMDEQSAREVRAVNGRLTAPVCSRTKKGLKMAAKIATKVKPAANGNGEERGEVLKEFPALGKYKVRLLKDRRDAVVLDVREYIDTDTWQGFTRKGIRLYDQKDVDALAAVLAKVKVGVAK